MKQSAAIFAVLAILMLPACESDEERKARLKAEAAEKRAARVSHAQKIVQQLQAREPAMSNLQRDLFSIATAIPEPGKYQKLPIPALDPLPVFDSKNVAVSTIEIVNQEAALEPNMPNDLKIGSFDGDSLPTYLPYRATRLIKTWSNRESILNGEIDDSFFAPSEEFVSLVDNLKYIAVIRNVAYRVPVVTSPTTFNGGQLDLEVWLVSYPNVKLLGFVPVTVVSDPDIDFKMSTTANEEHQMNKAAHLLKQRLHKKARQQLLESLAKATGGDFTF